MLRLQIQACWLATLLTVDHPFACRGKVFLRHPHPPFTQCKQTGLGDLEQEEGSQVSKRERILQSQK